MRSCDYLLARRFTFLKNRGSQDFLLSPKRALSCVLRLAYPIVLDRRAFSVHMHNSFYITLHSYTCFGLPISFFFFAGNVLGFIQEPPKTVYFMKGSDATFEWVYAVMGAELNSIIWSVENTTDGKEYALIVELANGTVTVNPQIPKAYLNRVEKIDRATLVVKNVIFDDSTTFSCLLRSTMGSPCERKSRIQLVVTGTFLVSIE